jgi:outer membrane lipoprotein SlyB
MKKLLFLPLIFILNGCVSSQDGLPSVRIIIDQAGIDINAYNNDLFECRQYAGQINAGSDALSGAIAGAIVGALVGAALDNSDTAKRTGGYGAIVGGAEAGGDAVQTQETVVKKCLVGRGYKVLN